MKKRRSILLVVALVLMILLSVHLTFYWATERSRAAKRAQFKIPASFVAHQKLADELSGEQPAGTFLTHGQEPSTQSAVFPADAEETIAGYERLFAHVQDLEQDETMSLLKDPSTWTTDEKVRVTAFVRANQDLTREIREMAGRGGPVCALDFTKPFEPDMDHVSHMRTCARWLRADAAVNAEGGNYAEMLADILAGFELGDALADEPIILSQLVRIAIFGEMVDTVQELINGGEVASDLVSQIVTYTDQSDNREAFANSLVGEVLVNLEAFRFFRGDEGAKPDAPFVALLSAMDSTGPRKALLAAMLYKTPLGRPWLNMDEETFIDVSNRLVAAVELPYYDALPQFDLIENDVENLPGLRVFSRGMLGEDTLSGTSTKRIRRLCCAQAEHEARLDLMQMGLLVEQYQVQQGSCPETLDVIAPGLGGSVPVDPFTGEPYRYEPSGDTFLLYSVGQNMTDDGGTYDSSDGDLVWRGTSE